MAIKHTKIAIPDVDKVDCVDWNADHVVDGNTGEVLFLTAGGNVDTDPNFFWDDVNKRLGIGTNNPQGTLHIAAATPQTETLRPNAAGDEESIDNATSGAGNHWQDVNETPPDEDTSKVWTGSDSYQRDLYDLPASSGSGTIIKITVYLRCRGSIGAGEFAKASIKSGATVSDGGAKTLTNSYVTYSQEWAVNPDDSEAWEWADIDALQIGVSLINYVGQNTYCTQVYVEVTYTDLNILIVGDRVGIGTTSPSAELDIVGSIVVDTDTLFVDSDNNRVGVGTTSPSDKLHISGGNIKIQGAGDTSLITMSGLDNVIDGYVYATSDNIGFLDSDLAWAIRVKTDDYIFFSINGSEKVRITSGGNVGIGTATPAVSAILDLTSTTGALLLPRMTTTQKNALTAVNGMILYDTDLNKFQGYENGVWTNLI